MHRLIAVILLASSLPGCESKIDFTKKDGVTQELGFFEYVGAVVYGEEPTDAPSGNPTVLLEGRTKKKADGSAYGVLRANRRLYAPFEVVLVAGLVPGEDEDGFTGNAGLTDEQLLAVGIGPIVDAGVQAFEDLSGAQADVPAAREALESSQSPLLTTLTGVEDLPDGKPKKQARAALKSAIKQVAAAIKRIDKGASTLKVLKKVGQATRSELKAIEALDPLPDP